MKRLWLQRRSREIRKRAKAGTVNGADIDTIGGTGLEMMKTTRITNTNAQGLPKKTKMNLGVGGSTPRKTKMHLEAGGSI